EVEEHLVGLHGAAGRLGGLVALLEEETGAGGVAARERGARLVPKLLRGGALLRGRDGGGGGEEERGQRCGERSESAHEISSSLHRCRRPCAGARTPSGRRWAERRRTPASCTRGRPGNASRWSSSASPPRTCASCPSRRRAPGRARTSDRSPRS